jgi:hypothetical protein
MLLLKNGAVALAIAFVYSAFGGFSYLPIVNRFSGYIMAPLALLSLLGYTVWKTTDPAHLTHPLGVALAVFDSVKYDFQYSLGFTLITMSSWVPDSVSHPSVLALEHALRFALFEFVAVAAEYPYQKEYLPKNETQTLA